MDDIQNRILRFKSRIDMAIAQWGPFTHECDFEWIAAVRRFQIDISGPVPPAELDRIETDKAFRFPEEYRAFLELFGHFTVGDGSAGSTEELCLFAPQRISRTYADYLKDAEFSDEVNRATYEPFLVFAEDGVFPQEDRTTSRILAFHRAYPELLLTASCDEMGYQEPRDSRQNPGILTTFLAKALDSIEDHAGEPLEGLAADIEFYSSEEDN